MQLEKNFMGVKPMKPVLTSKQCQMSETVQSLLKNSDIILLGESLLFEHILFKHKSSVKLFILFSQYTLSTED